jgi:hypothetical protein
MKVDLPEPLGPSRPRISPAAPAGSRRRSACTPLKDLDAFGTRAAPRRQRRLAASPAATATAAGAAQAADGPATCAGAPRRAFHHFSAWPSMPSGMNRITTPAPRPSAPCRRPRGRRGEGVQQQVIAAAPTPGPAQCRVPPSTLMSTTVSGTVMLKVSPVVTYETNSAWMPPTTPASPHESAKAPACSGRWARPSPRPRPRRRGWRTARAQLEWCTASEATSSVSTATPSASR